MKTKNYGCRIRLHRQDFIGSDSTLLHYWTGLSFQQFCQWEWYFRYRAALAQVANSLFYIEFTKFNYEFIQTEQEERKRLKDKLTAKKAKLTTCINKMKAYESAWNSLFPISTDPSYQLAMAKVEKLRSE